MDSNLPIEGQENQPQKKSFISTHIKKIVLIVVFLLALLSLVYMYVTPSAPQTSKEDTTMTNSPSQATSDDALPTETTTNTASSLEIPPLYPDATWKEQTTQPPDDKLNVVVAANKTNPFLEVPLTGYYNATTVQDTTGAIEKYYADALEKQGWSVNGSRLQFTTYSLQGLFADGPCGGVEGFVGSKDGFIKTVTIQHQSTPCALPNTTPALTKPSTNYTIFISESISVLQITEYIKSHSK